MLFASLKLTAKPLAHNALFVRVNKTISCLQYCRYTTRHASAFSYYHNIGKEPLVYRNVGQHLERSVSIYGNNTAVVSCHENKRYTYKELIEEVDRLAAGFLKIGLQSGDYIALWGPNNMSWYLGMLAAARIGAVSVGINPAFQAPEAEYCLQKVKVKAIVMPESFRTQHYYEMLCGICPELANAEKGKLHSARLPHLRAVIVDAPTRLSGAFGFDELLALPTAIEHVAKLQASIVPDTPCNVQFTSGTTGTPKAALLSHYNFVNNSVHFSERNELEGQRICMQVPLFHVFGVTLSIMSSMAGGAALIMPAAGYSPEASLRAIVSERCSVIYGTPTMHVDLVRKQRELQLPLGALVQLVVSGGAPLSPQLVKDIRQVLGAKRVHSIYGLTETTAATFSSLPSDDDERMLHTVGQLQDHVEAKVVDERGHMVPFGQPGELCVRGYVTMLGYYGDEQKTKETIGADKWLRTGDQFILQEDGYGRIVGRLKDMIIRGGENVFPKEIEDFLNTHPNIAESHVIGVPDERMGEEICAFVRLNNPADQTCIAREALKDYFKGKLAHYKVPRYTYAIADFPKTTSGKIQKFKLLEIYKSMCNDKAAAASSRA